MAAKKVLRKKKYGVDILRKKTVNVVKIFSESQNVITATCCAEYTSGVERSSTRFFKTLQSRAVEGFNIIPSINKMSRKLSCRKMLKLHYINNNKTQCSQMWSTHPVGIQK